MQENCKANGDVLCVLQQNIKPGENLRQAGDDIQAGALMMAKGHRLKPQDIGLLASIGLESVNVTRRLRVSLLTTGDEVGSWPDLQFELLHAASTVERLAGRSARLRHSGG